MAAKTCINAASNYKELNSLLNFLILSNECILYPVLIYLI